MAEMLFMASKQCTLGKYNILVKNSDQYHTPPPQTRNIFTFASAADSSNCSKYEADTLSGNTSAGIQFEPFMNTGIPLILKKNDLPEIENTAHMLIVFYILPTM